MLLYTHVRCKMAGGSVAVSNLLCFLSNKYGKCAVRQLKSMIIDFYDVSDLCGAKRQLIDDIKGMNLNVDMPHVPDRRRRWWSMIYLHCSLSWMRI